MASYTENLRLFKRDPLTEGEEYFDISAMLNDNWDKIDLAVLLISSVVNDLTTGGAAVPLSAEQGKTLKSLIDLKAALASPTFTGTPKAPTAAATVNNTQIATTAFANRAAQNAAAGKQDTLTFDSTPTAGSSNPVTSGGIKAAIDAAGGGSSITVDSALSGTSTNPVQNKVVKAAIDGKASTTHGHAISDVTGLQTALDGKASGTHSHGISDITNLQTTLDGKQLKPTMSTMTLAVASWSSGVYSLEGTYPAATYDVEVDLNGDSCTLAQMEAWAAAKPVGSPTGNKIKALGDVPTVAIPVVVKAWKK